MNIILGSDRAKELSEKYIVLELDTITFDGITPVTAYSVVDFSLEDLPTADSVVRVHQDLMSNYKARKWELCLNAIQYLVGSWRGELDSFYENLKDRVESNQANEPDENWTGWIHKVLG